MLRSRTISAEQAISSTFFVSFSAVNQSLNVRYCPLWLTQRIHVPMVANVQYVAVNV